MSLHQQLCEHSGVGFQEHDIGEAAIGTVEDLDLLRKASPE